MTFRVLVAEDESIALKYLLSALAEENIEARGVSDGLEAWNILQNSPFNLLVSDIRMPGLNGLELLKLVKEAQPDIDVIIITAFASVNSAIEAMKQGAYDYLTKPLDLDEFTIKVKNIRRQRKLIRQNTALKISNSALGGSTHLIADSTEMKKVLSVIQDVSKTDCNLLITGESGTGKSMIAKMIHDASPRQQMPFLSINCAALNENLLESEIFGYEAGAFTGARTKKQGLVEVVDTGTLLFDEIAEMSPKLQAKLLELIESGQFFHVGSTKSLRVDVRFIGATNRIISQCIEEGTFREDLYFRLNVVEVHMPPLRERKKDIEPLCEFFLEKHAKKINKKIIGFELEVMEKLKQYSFPGNVRELENLVERGVILEKSTRITKTSLPESLQMFQIETFAVDQPITAEQMIQDYAQLLLEKQRGNRTETARLLGISRTKLWRILKDIPNRNRPLT